MKKTIVIAMLAAGSALSMSHAFAAAGTVNFNGNILDAACDVDVASKNQVVVLGDYYKTEFPAAGSRTEIRYYFEKLSGNCYQCQSALRWNPRFKQFQPAGN